LSEPWPASAVSFRPYVVSLTQKNIGVSITLRTASVNGYVVLAIAFAVVAALCKPTTDWNASKMISVAWGSRSVSD
jgi:hypothetical protein